MRSAEYINATVGVRLYTKCGQPPGITMMSPADCRNAMPPILINVSFSCLRKCEVLTDALKSAKNAAADFGGAVTHSLVPLTTCSHELRPMKST